MVNYLKYNKANTYNHKVSEKMIAKKKKKASSLIQV